MKNLILISALFIFTCTIFSCQKDDLEKTNIEQPTKPQQYFKPLDLNELSSRNSCPWQVIPAGSVNVLQQAIDDICEEGIIYLKTGTHTESEVISINKSVKIIGEDGAVLKIASAEPSPWDADFNLPVHPAIYIKDAPKTLIQNIKIDPFNPNGNTAIFFQNSNYSAVIRCEISDFQHGILMEKSNQITIMQNTITTSDGWLSGEFEEAYGIFAIGGKSAYIANNELSNAFFGIWACDEWGTFENNYMHGNYGGLLLCNAPQYILLPNGDIIGSPKSGTGWKVRNNKSQNNLDAGYLVIDGADRNILQNNEGGNNGTYDIELAGESDRFGYTTPTSTNNAVEVGSFTDIVVKVCGVNNTVNGGGILIDTSIDPCN